MWAQLTSVQVTGSYITFLSFGFPVWEAKLTAPIMRKEGTCGEKCSVDGPPLLVLPRHLPPPLPLVQLPDELSHLCLSDSPPKYHLAH